MLSSQGPIRVVVSARPLIRCLLLDGLKRWRHQVDLKSGHSLRRMVDYIQAEDQNMFTSLNIGGVVLSLTLRCTG